VEGETEIWLLSELAQICGYSLRAEGVRIIEFAQCGQSPLIKVARDFGIEWHLLADGDEARLTLVAIVAWEYGTAARHTIEAQRLDVANNLRILIDREIDHTAGFLDGISNAPLLREHDAQFMEKVTGVARQRGYHSLIVFDIAGAPTLVSAALAKAVPAADVGLAEIKAGKKVFVSNLVAGAGDRPGLYFVSVPIVYDGDLMHCPPVLLWG
jgi:hypothetical protein